LVDRVMQCRQAQPSAIFVGDDCVVAQLRRSSRDFHPVAGQESGAVSSKRQERLEGGESCERCERLNEQYTVLSSTEPCKSCSTGFGFQNTATAGRGYQVKKGPRMCTFSAGQFSRSPNQSTLVELVSLSSVLVGVRVLVIPEVAFHQQP
jgi:hypothetical protein